MTETTTTRKPIWKMHGRHLPQFDALYLTYDDALNSAKLWLEDEERVEVLTDIESLRGCQDDPMVSIRIVVPALGTHAHQTIYIERIHTGDCTFLVATVRQGMDHDPNPEDNIIITDDHYQLNKAEAAEAGIKLAAEKRVGAWRCQCGRLNACARVHCAKCSRPKEHAVLESRVENSIGPDVTFEQDLARALANAISPFLERGRQRVSLDEVASYVAGHLNINRNDQAMDRDGAYRCLMSYMAPVRLCMEEVPPVTPEPNLWWRFMATVEEHLTEDAYRQWMMVQTKVIKRGSDLWLQLHK